MSLDQLRKRIQELKEKGLLRSGYEAPGMEDIYPPTNPAPVKPYRAQEIVAPTTPTATPISTNAPRPLVPSVNTANNNQPKNEPKMGQNGSKALDEFLANISDYYREQRSQDLTDAYSAGFNGLDISRKTRDNAAVDGNLKQIEAMYNAGQADAKTKSTAVEPDNGLSTEAAREEQIALNNSRNTASSNNTANNNVKSTSTTARTVPAAQMPKTTPISTPKPSVPSTTPTTTNTPKIDPKTGVYGAKVFSDITTKKPTLGENSINDLIDAYNAGYNGTDINDEIKVNARAGKYMPELEAIYNAGITDASKKLAAQNNEHENLMRTLNMKQAQKLAHTSDDDGLGIEAHRRDQFLQKKHEQYGEAWKLNVKADQREGDLWCWAACMSTIDNFYNPGKGITQEDLHSDVRKSDTSRTQDTDFGVPDCRPSVNFNLDSRVEEVPSYKTIEYNMSAGRPIVLHTIRPGAEKPSHFIVLVGCYVKDGVRYVIINENRDGKQYTIPYDKLVVSFTTCKNAQKVYGYFTTSKYKVE